MPHSADHEAAGKDGHDHAHGETHKGSLFGKIVLLETVGTENKASIVELFYDLIFVAAMYRLGLLMGDILSHDDYGADWHEILLLFTILYLTWHHANMFLARFKLQKPWDILLFALMALTVLLAIGQAYYQKVYDTCTIPGKDSGVFYYETCLYKGYSDTMQNITYGDGDKGYHYSIESGLRTKRFLTIWGISRIIMAALYGAAAAYNQEHGGKMSLVYMGFLLTSAFMILMVGHVPEELTVPIVEPVVAVAVIVEFLMYPLALYMLKSHAHPAIDVEHNVERAELWAVLVMGETMLTLVQGASEKYDPNDETDGEYYVAVCLGFLIVYLLLDFYHHSLPHSGGMDTHIYDLSAWGSIVYDLFHLISTLGLFGFGVGLKYTMKYGHYKDGGYLKQHYCFFITGCLSLAIVGMTLGRFSHEWASFKVCGIERKIWWGLHFITAACIPPLAFAVHVNKDTGEVEGIRATEFLGAIVGLLILTEIFDAISQPTHEVHEDLRRFQEEHKKLTEEGIAPVGVDVDKVDTEVLKSTAEDATLKQFRTRGNAELRFSAEAMTKAREAFHDKTHGIEDPKVAGKRASLHQVKDVGLFSLYQENLDKIDPGNMLSNKSIAKKMWKRGAMRASIGRKFSFAGNDEKTHAAAGSLATVDQKISMVPEGDEEARGAEATAEVRSEGESVKKPSVFKPRSSKVAPADAPAAPADGAEGGTTPDDTVEETAV